MNGHDVVEPDDLKPVGVGVTTIIEDYPFDATRMNARLAGDDGRERFRLLLGKFVAFFAGQIPVEGHKNIIDPFHKLIVSPKRVHLR